MLVAERRYSRIWISPVPADCVRSGTRRSARSSRNRARTRPRAARAPATSASVIPVMSRNGVVCTTPSTITRTRPTRSVTNTRRVSPVGEPAQVGDVKLPSVTSEGAAPAGAASARTSRTVSQAARTASSSHPRRSSEPPHVAGRVDGLDPQRELERGVPAQRAPHGAGAAPGQPHGDHRPAARNQRPGRAPELRHAADRSPHRRATRFVGPQRDRQPSAPAARCAARSRAPTPRMPARPRAAPPKPERRTATAPHPPAATPARPARPPGSGRSRPRRTSSDPARPNRSTRPRPGSRDRRTAAPPRRNRRTGSGRRASAGRGRAPRSRR